MRKLQAMHANDSTDSSNQSLSEFHDNVIDEIFQEIGILHFINDPTVIPEDTRMRFLKRVIQRFIRSYTKSQVDYNKRTTAILGNLTGKVKELSKYIRSLDQAMREVKADQQIIHRELRDLKRSDEEKSRSIAELESELSSLKKNVSSEVIDKKIRETRESLSHNIHELHTRVEDEKTSIYEVIENLKEEMAHNIRRGDENIVQNLHKRIEDEKKGLMEIIPDIGTLEYKTQEAKEYADNVARHLHNSVKELEERFTPEEIFNLFSRANNLADHIYYKLEENFRGEGASILRQQQNYADMISGHHQTLGNSEGHYLDVGCGRGELLQILKEKGIPSRGIDVNYSMVEHCLQIGLDVTQIDFRDYLEEMPDNSLRGIIALQVIEHLSINRIFELLSLGFKKIQRGGVFILETVNPESVYAMRWFYMDYTHNKPLPSAMIEFLVRMAGFENTEVIPCSPVEGWKQLASPEDDGIAEQNFHKLNNFLFGYQDYAIKAIK